MMGVLAPVAFVRQEFGVEVVRFDTPCRFLLASYPVTVLESFGLLPRTSDFGSWPLRLQGVDCMDAPRGGFVLIRATATKRIQ